ncbi:hypothetical protein KSP40_PGU004630 [Platanthera guangdongensis]|uniref:Uncharacterized protein n=1 Tax=Platanthera guangdongensis TaxID=2320717 RepID=A0ABR2MK68_9ASPA
MIEEEYRHVGHQDIDIQLPIHLISPLDPLVLTAFDKPAIKCNGKEFHYGTFEASDAKKLKDDKEISMASFLSWFIWRSARFYVAVNWATTFIFGRDNSRIG